MTDIALPYSGPGAGARSGDAIDELGMEGVPIPPDRITDPFEKLLPGYSSTAIRNGCPCAEQRGFQTPARRGCRWDLTSRKSNVAVLKARRRSRLWRSKQLTVLRPKEAR